MWGVSPGDPGDVRHSVLQVRRALQVCAREAELPPQGQCRTFHQQLLPQMLEMRVAQNLPGAELPSAST